MSNQTHQILLIDLSKQFPFEIDDEKKEQLCFSETLIISCAHGKGDLENQSSESEWSFTESEDDKKKKDNDDMRTSIKTVDKIQDNYDNKAVEEEEEDNFDFYFFQDCKQPISNDSRNSILLQDGMPILNPSKRKDCACIVGKVKVCPCFTKIPCSCGDKPIDDCDCAQTDKTICTCDKLTCSTDGFCLTGEKKTNQAEESENVCDEPANISDEPTNVSDEPRMLADEPENICRCPVTPKSSRNDTECMCFPLTNVSDPDIDQCECCVLCEPCASEQLDSCSCSIKELNKADESYPQHKEILKLKRKRAGKHGYRWCHEVDPKHTFFDYAYDRHDKIESNIQEEEKVKILGLHEDTQDECRCEDEENEIETPLYKIKYRHASLDCCSAVGGINISVEVLGEDKNKFLIQVVSHSSKEGAKCGSKLVSIVDCCLHTLEENRSEHITRNDVMKQRRSYMSICENGYYNKVTRICGERSLVKRTYHSFEDASNFLLEGANIVLLRYFGITRYKGQIKTHTVIINGTVCENVYVCLGVSQAIVNGKALFTAKVERHIIEPSGLIHQSLTVLTLKGYIVSHEWAYTSYIFHVNPLLNVIPEKDEIETHEPLRERWRSDLQLLSDYLDFKSARTSEGARYVSENGDLSGVIRDYLQALLLLRPQDALNFTQQYFESALSDLDLPHNDFFQPPHKNVRYYFFED